MQSSVNIQLITNEISVKRNNIPEKEYTISPKVTRNITAIDEKHTAVELILEILNQEETPFPLDIRVSLTGIFDISTLPKESVDRFLKVQTVQILYPYIRTMVSNITASSMLPPIILPLTDAATMFPEQ